MNRRNTIVLVGLFVVLAAYAYYTQARTGGSASITGTPSPTAAVVLDFVTDKVIQFQVKDLQKNQTVLVSRQGDTWHMEQPKDSPTDPLRINQTLGTLAHLEATRVLTNVTDLGAFGLISPTIEARMTLSDTTEYALQFGDQNPAKTAYYTLKSGDQFVYLVSSSTVDDLKDYLANPPYPPTVTPTPLPTLTATITPTVTITGTLGTPNATPVGTPPSQSSTPTDTPLSPPAESPAATMPREATVAPTNTP